MTSTLSDQICLSWWLSGLDHHLRNDLKCVEWDIKLCSIQCSSDLLWLSIHYWIT